MAKPAKKLSFNDGYVLDSKHIYMASQLEEYSDMDMSRVSIIIDGQWKYADFDDDAVLSVACLQKERLTFFMGTNGNIYIGGRGKIEREVVPVTEDLGTLLRIRNIGEVMYISGMTGQVYRRSDRGWVAIDAGVRGEEGLDFEDIGGTGGNNLYAASSAGFVCHFNGQQWRKLDLPTNRPFSGVRCVSEDEVYICGDDGNLFRGSRDNWQFIGDKGIDENFWAVEKFQDKVYVSYDNGLFEYDGTKLSKVNLRLKGRVDGHRLHANDGVLWSFGEEHLLCFDGSTWRRVVCPMNT